MQPSSVSPALEILPKPQEVVVPSLEFAARLNRDYVTETKLLRYLNPVQSRPFEKQQRTIGERIFDLDDPRDVMEYNRTCMNVWLFDLVSKAQTESEIEAAYEAFVDCQKESSRLAEEEILTFENFSQLKQIVDATVPPEMRELFRANLVYGDLGKSLEMQTYVREEMGFHHANHDRVVARVMRDQTATERFMPSLLRFNENEQNILLGMQESGFHLGQYQKFESLAADSEAFVDLPAQLQDMVMLGGLFDIAGAQGDRVQNGSMTLTNGTFEAFMRVRDAFRDYPEPIAAGTPKEKALYSYDGYQRARNEEYGFDLDTPEGVALLRYVCQVRTFKRDEIGLVEDAFANKLSPETQMLFKDLLTRTGYEPEGAVWFEYGPATARNVFRKLKEAGLAALNRKIAAGEMQPEDVADARRTIVTDALMHSMTTLGRLRSSARKLVAPGMTKIVAASQIADIAENDLGRLLTERIMIEPVGDDEGIARLEPLPRATIRERLDNLDTLRNPDSLTLYIGVGGGSDCDFARMTASELIGDTQAPVTSFPGVDEHDIHNATKIADNVYLAQSDTYFTGPRRRCFERYAAEHGPCYIISGAGSQAYNHLDEAFVSIARHAQAVSGKKLTQIITIDSGGDIFEPVGPSGMRRDHRSLQALERLERDLGITNSHTVALLAGPDAPRDLDEITSQLPVAAYHIGSHAEAIVREYERRDWPSAASTDYSERVETAYRTLVTYLRRGSYGVEPLSLPNSEVLRRPAYTITSEALLDALVVPNEQLRQAVLRVQT